MNRRAERGISLLVVLIMLVVLTLFALSAINLSTSNLKVVGNMQARQVNESIASQAVETVMGSINYFTTPTSSVDTSSSASVAPYSATIDSAVVRMTSSGTSSMLG